MPDLDGCTRLVEICATIHLRADAAELALEEGGQLGVADADRHLVGGELTVPGVQPGRDLLRLVGGPVDGGPGLRAEARVATDPDLGMEGPEVVEAGSLLLGCDHERVDACPRDAQGAA